jgi:hypothetical protein
MPSHAQEVIKKESWNGVGPFRLWVGGLAVDYQFYIAVDGDLAKSLPTCFTTARMENIFGFLLFSGK